MDDLNKLNLENSESVKEIDRSAYWLPEHKLAKMPDILEFITARKQWSPEFQAWRVFLDKYMLSGSYPALTLRWEEILLMNERAFRPCCDYESDLVGEIVTAYRSRDREVLPNTSWTDIIAVRNKFDLLSKNRKMIMDFIRSTIIINESMEKLLEKKPEEKYSNNIQLAVYLYTHAALGSSVFKENLTQRLREQLLFWLEDYKSAFDDVAEFIGNTEGVYAWYTPKIRDFVAKVWYDSLDIKNGKTFADFTALGELPVFLKNALLDELAWMPTMQSVKLNEEYVFNAIMSAINIKKNDGDLRFVHVFCIPQNIFRARMNFFHDVVRDIDSGRFVRNMIAMHKLNYLYGSPQHPLTPEQYRNSLIERGIPIIGSDDVG